MYLSYHPLAAGDKRYDFRCDVAAYERTYGDAGDGSHGGQCENRLEHTCPHAEPEYVHEIHAVAQFGQVGYDLWSFLRLYACEHEERSGSEHHAVDGAESPAYLYLRGGVGDARNSLHIERPYGDGGSGCHECHAADEACLSVPCEVHPYVVCHDKITKIAREVPEHVILVPETLSPYLAAPAVEERDACGDEEEHDEETLLPRCRLAQPR